MSVRRRRRRKKEKRREETRTTERQKEKNCKLGVFGGKTDFNIYRGNLILNILILRFETRNFVRRVQLRE